VRWRAGWIAAALFFAFAAEPARAQEVPAAADERFPLDLRDRELAEVVREISGRTGVPFLFDDRLRGRVSILAPRAVTRGEALELLVSALRVVGFATVRGASGVTEIVPIGESAGRAPVSMSTPRAHLDSPLSTLVALEAAQAESLLPIVQPLLGPNAVVQAFPPTNTLILSATEGQLHRVLVLVRALDRAESRHLSIFRTRYRDVQEILPIVEATFPESRRRSESLRVLADARTAALLVEGPPELVAEVGEFVRSIDRPTPGEGGLHVIRLRHADALDVAEVVRTAAAPARSSAADASEPEAERLSGRAFSVAVDEPTNSLVIACDEETLRVIGEIVAKLDVNVPLVTVRATLMEVENTGALDVGVDSLLPFSRPATPSEATGFARLLNSGDPSLLGAQPADRGEQGLLFRYIDDPVIFERIDPETGETILEQAPSWEVVVKAFAQDTNTRILSEPMILARSGEEQEVFVGNNIPIVSATQSSADGGVAAGDPLAISQNVERQDVGVTLRVSPNVPQEGPVRLELRLEFSAVTAPFAGSVEEVGPTLIEQEVESTIYLEDGEGAVVGVRGQPTQEVVRQGTPWLMNVPALGWIFGSVSTRSVRRDLVLTVQIKVMRSPEDLEAESIRRRIAVERSLEGLEGLRLRAGEAPFAVWAGTLEDRAGAEALALRLQPGAGRVEILPWKGHRSERHDVFVLGFDRYADAMKASLELRGQGFDPEVVAIPASI
jgi:general secretion pathway protein D